jgi:hypothetical protein
MGVPPLPPAIGIISLGGKSRKIFEFKGLIGKIFRNKDLRLSKSSENGFGAASRTVLGNGCASALPHHAIIVAWGGVGVCDGAHRAIVMKKMLDKIVFNPSIVWVIMVV